VKCASERSELSWAQFTRNDDNGVQSAQSREQSTNRVHRYRCPLRWGDMDAQGHVNNAAYVDYLQEARVDFLLSGPPLLRQMLSSGVLVISHQMEYLRPLQVLGQRPLDIDLWVDSVGASRFVIGYELFDGPALAGRARTALVPYDLATDSLRRLTLEERGLLSGELTTAEPLRALPKSDGNGHGHRYPLRVRWSDLDSYGHVNNVKYYDFIQEARLALFVEILGWPAENTKDEVWLVVRQDVDYLQPMDFRPEPYEIVTVVSRIGSRSITLEAEIRDPSSRTGYARARTIVVGQAPFTESQRAAFSA
jgi:acyl-CoA thioester hydrolase